MKFTLDIDLDDYYGGGNGALDLLDDIKDRIASQMLKQTGYYTKDKMDYDEQLKGIISKIENDILKGIVKKVDTKEIVERTTNKLKEDLATKVTRTQCYQYLIKELTDEGATESELAKQFRDVIKQEIKKVIHV